MATLLVAFDGSESATRALRHAIERAQASPPTSLLVVNAHAEPQVYPEVGMIMPYEQQREMQQQTSEHILGQAEAILAESGVPHEREILIGDVGRRIAERADQRGCGGIVMGTHGRTAVANLLMGSVATKVVHFAHVPVTLVK